MDFKIATNIETSNFNLIIHYLKKGNWKIICEYDEKLFDKGIDFDLYEFEKEGVRILLVWSNWFEGEMKATDKLFSTLEKQLNISFTYGEAEYLKNQNIIADMHNLLKFKR